MVRDFFTTSAAYSTGTVAVTNGSTTVTLTGGTWPSDVASGSYHFALSVSDPWYVVNTRSSDTVIVLVDNYEGTTDSSTTYAVYKSHYSLASDADRVEGMWLHDAGRAVPLVLAVTEEQVSEFLHYPSGPGVPTHFLPIERDSSGNLQVLLGPETPDAVYRVEYVYRKKVTDDTFTGNLDESRWPVILARASAILYEPEFYERSLRAQREYERLLKIEWENTTQSETQGFQVGQARVAYPGSTGYLDHLMGFGRVQDPS